MDHSEVNCVIEQPNNIVKSYSHHKNNIANSDCSKRNSSLCKWEIIHNNKLSHYSDTIDSGYSETEDTENNHTVENKTIKNKYKVGLYDDIPSSKLTHSKKEIRSQAHAGTNIRTNSALNHNDKGKLTIKKCLPPTTSEQYPICTLYSLSSNIDSVLSDRESTSSSDCFVDKDLSHTVKTCATTWINQGGSTSPQMDLQNFFWETSSLDSLRKEIQSNGIRKDYFTGYKEGLSQKNEHIELQRTNNSSKYSESSKSAYIKKYTDHLSESKNKQLTLLKKRQSKLHKMIDSWYEQLHDQLEFTYEHDVERIERSFSSPTSETDSEADISVKPPSKKMCSVLNTNTKLLPQDFGTLNTHYTTDLDNDIWAFEMSEAVHLRTFESRDKDVHTEYMATSLSINKDGEFIISDLGADTCRIFTTEGRLVCDFDIYPLSEPSHVLPLDNDCYLVSCCDGLQLFNSKGKHEPTRGAINDVKCPQCVALDHKGNYIVSDMHDCGSVIITIDKESLLPVSMFCGTQFDDSPQAFKKAWYIHITEDKSIILSDREDHVVKCYTRHGKFQWSSGGFGSRNGQFVTPAGLTEDRLGNIIVADNGNDRVSILSGDGNWLSEVVSEDHGIKSPTDVAITKDGNLAVLQSNGSVSVFKYLHKIL